ncbi:MAG: hypothetical protein V1743_03735 [Nanoarchaeota archaeon]
MSFLFATSTAAKAGATAATSGASFVILPAILFGLVISLVEMIFVHQDERGMGWMAHGLHAVPVTIMFTFITMNVPWAMSLVPNFSYASWMEPLVIFIVGIIAMGKVLAAAAIAGRVGEKKIHVLIIGLLIIAAPYAWKFVLKGIIGPLLPFQ